MLIFLQSFISITLAIYFQIELIYILQHHPEGTVRKEVVSVLTEIFVNQKVSTKFQNLMYCVMSTAALSDQHWEVQMAAIAFWKKAIQNNLHNRGMIDGKFPAVTFSREKRKIITLNQEEIHKQLSSILNELAQIGCLYVLNQSMSDVNLKVEEQAYNVAKELIEILTNHNFNRVAETPVFEANKNIKTENEEKKYESCVPMDLSCDFEIVNNQDQVIDSIVNTTQTELIEKLYEDYVEVKNERTAEEVLRHDTSYHVMNPNDFLDNFRNNDFLRIIEEKKNWNSGMKDLNYMLDELLSLDGLKSTIDLECN